MSWGGGSGNPSYNSSGPNNDESDDETIVVTNRLGNGHENKTGAP